ncbi:MAG TPA: D-glycero-beta-D-manno-heptose 1-phosphate adenylyltransferase [Puia sp.]|nr:D-glycero-beta-D-manno-heptose 1-phosphate adenylyltransferase [Puia sp.]
MRNPQIIQQKILDLPKLQQQVSRWKFLKKSIAFTNGCFDILHQGHIASLSQAAAEADFLIVGVNADESVRKLKGEHRPINDQHSRAILLASLLMVDVVIIFEEDTPLNLINAVLPDVLVKGGDYTIEEIVGAKEVIANGGRVVINSIVPGFSTSGLIEKIHRL